MTNKSILLGIFFIFAIVIVYLVFATNTQPQQDSLVQKAESTPITSSSVQDVYLKALGTGLYDKKELTVKKGVLVRLHFTAEPDSACGRALILRNFGVNLLSKNGDEAIAEFTPEKEGVYEYSCPMGMFRGKLIVN
ncbi:MAG: cupredoxin domain-containing protein [Candidatus Micrarchaeota archaeon]